jgi:hypothetical protein
MDSHSIGLVEGEESNEVVSKPHVKKKSGKRVENNNEEEKTSNGSNNNTNSAIGSPKSTPIMLKTQMPTKDDHSPKGANSPRYSNQLSISVPAELGHKPSDNVKDEHNRLFYSHDSILNENSIFHISDEQLEDGFEGLSDVEKMKLQFKKHKERLKQQELELKKEKERMKREKALIVKHEKEEAIRLYKEERERERKAKEDAKEFERLLIKEKERQAKEEKERERLAI